MKKHVLNNRRAWSRGIAIYQLAGGNVMIILFFLYLVDQLNVTLLLVLSPLIGLFMASLFAGIFFFTGKYERFYFLSKLNFCAQLLQLTVPGFVFRYYYGPYLSIGADGNGSLLARFELLTANFGIEIGAEEETLVLINLVPILALVVLRWLERNPETNVKELEDAFIDEQQPV